MKSSLAQLTAHRYVRLGLVVVAIIFCVIVIQSAARYGSAQVLTTYSLATGNLTTARTAIQTAPRDAEAHFAHGALLSLSGKPSDAIVEFERAVALRPADSGLWTELGLLRDQLGDKDGALAAFDEALQRAPHYSQPRWNRGNVLLRNGQYESAFRDLNEAAESNPALLPNLMSLAWGVARKDVQQAEELAQINSDQKRIAFTRFLVWQGEAQQALAQYRKTSSVSEGIKRELVEQLLVKGAVKEAFEIWKGDRGNANGQAESQVYDGGFEGSLSFTERTFGWRVPRELQATKISVDATQPQSGSKDLRVEFNGNSDPGAMLISQLLVVEPNARYRINFTARSQDIVTGGLPIIVAVDNGRSKLLGKSLTLAKGTTDWQPYSFEFTTSSQTSGIVLSLQRENCASSPCPIFGALSLDSFSLERLK